MGCWRRRELSKPYRTKLVSEYGRGAGNGERRNGTAMEGTVPGTTSTEKVKRIGAYGAKVHVCDTGNGNDVALGYHAGAERIARERDVFISTSIVRN
jgi:hypothetical protein